MRRLIEKIIQDSVDVDNSRVEQISAVAMTYDTLEELCYELDIEDNSTIDLEDELSLSVLIMCGHGIDYKFMYFA